MAMTGQAGGPAAPQSPSGRWSALWGGGMLLMFVGERMIGAGKSRGVATVLGLAAVLAAMAVRFLRAQRAAPDRRYVERILLGLYALGLFAFLLYLFQSDLWASAFGKPLEKNWPRLATALAALWPAVWVCAAWPVLLSELAYGQIARAPRLEVGRIRDATLSGFGLAFALVFAFSLAYVSSERDKKVDLAYFRTTRPGEVTRRIVRNLDQPIEVALFFPAGNEVREEVDNYLNDLSKESAQLKVTHYDYDIDPLKAKEYGINTNGVMVFVRGKRHEQLGLPKELEAARSPLKSLDKEVQQRLMMVVKPPRTFAFTLGHGERSWEKPESDTDKRPGLKTLRDVLVDQTYDVRTLSAAEGLGQDVPKDISVVAVIGPQKPFLPEESAALNRYIDRGGRVLIALDPENKVDMHEVLEPLSLSYKAEMLANDQVFARRTHQDSDRANLVTATFTSHPSVTTLQRLGARAPLIFPGAGWINTKRERSSAVPVDAPIKAHYATFVDKNGNYQADPGEDRRAWELGATAVKKDARVFVLADSDCLDDEAIRAGANELLALDVAHWLVGDEAFAGIPSTEADVPITHTRKQDVVWFYSTIFLAPALVIGIGVGVTRGGRRRKRRPGDASGGAPAQGAAS
jgi:hypothetical protein